MKTASLKSYLFYEKPLWIHSGDQPLLLISTGIAIDKKSAEDLLSALQIEESAMNSFIKDRLGEDSEKSIFDPIKKQKLTTFGSLYKKKVIKTKAKVISIQNSKDLFFKSGNHCSTEINPFERTLCLSFDASSSLDCRCGWYA